MPHSGSLRSSDASSTSSAADPNSSNDTRTSLHRTTRQSTTTTTEDSKTDLRPRCLWGLSSFSISSPRPLAPLVVFPARHVRAQHPFSPQSQTVCRPLRLLRLQTKRIQNFVAFFVGS